MTDQRQNDDGESPWGDRLALSIEEVAERTPLSKTTLYRVANQPGSPFRKVAGRWMTTPAAFEAWVEAGEIPKPRSASADPMPKRGGRVLSNVLELRRQPK